MTDPDTVHPQPDKPDLEAWLTILENVYLDGKAPQSWPDVNSQSASLKKLVDDLLAIRQFILRIAEGDLSFDLKVKGNLAGSLKTLQANLRYLTWQVQQVANGDLTQRIEYMGDLSTAFNQMTRSLDKAYAELQNSEMRYRLLAENAADVIWTMDLEGRFTYISPSVEALRGFSVEEAMAQTIEEALTLESARLVREKMAELTTLLASGQPIPEATYELEQPKKDGSTVWIEVTVSLMFDLEGNLLGIQGASRDITERRRAQKAEREQRELAEALRDTAAALNSAKSLEEVFDSLLTNISRVVPHDTVDILTVDSNGNARIKRSEGYQNFIKGDLDQLYELILPVEQTPNLREMAETGLPCRIDNLKEYGWVKTDASDWARSQLGAPILVKGKVVGFLTLLSAQTSFFTEEQAMRLRAFADQAAIAIEKASLFEQLNEMATIDSLTGIANRRHFFNLAEAEITRAIRYNRPLSALMMDIDHFKQVNDTFGHNMGDEVLQAVAQRCSAVLRNNDLFGRYGGEEFSFLLPETDIDGAMRVADRLRRVISSKPFIVRNSEAKVTVSLGATSFNRSIPSARALIDRADQALYLAKLGGRNRVAKVE